MNWKIDDVIILDEESTVRNVMSELRQGKYFRKGFLEISAYDNNRDTFLVDNFYNGTETREELSAATVRKIVKEFL